MDIPAAIHYISPSPSLSLPNSCKSGVCADATTYEGKGGGGVPAQSVFAKGRKKGVGEEGRYEVLRALGYGRTSMESGKI